MWNLLGKWFVTMGMAGRIWGRLGFALGKNCCVRVTLLCHRAGISFAWRLPNQVESFSKLLLYYCNKSFNSTLLIYMSFSNYYLLLLHRGQQECELALCINCINCRIIALEFVFAR